MPSGDSGPAGPGPHDLVAEAQRQLTICNSCRYCAGYCPVWPELELRTALSTKDLGYLANLCHDCQDCFTACMYTAPHEFDLNPPAVFAGLREETYEAYRWPRRWPFPGWAAVLVAYLVVGGLLGLLAYLFGGEGAVGSPYRLVPHGLLVAVVGLPAAYSLVVIGTGAVRFWRDTYGPLRGLLRVPGWGRTARDVLTLRHQSGGGADCEYPGDEPGRARRIWHHLLAYGLGLCAVSTASAAVQQQFLGLLPPYPYLSVPVLTGSAGGVAMLAGGTGLLVLKSRSDPARTSTAMRSADYGFLWALLALAGTGMLALVLRGGALFGPVYLAHLDAVVVAFAICPYTKFPHWVYRTLAIRKYHLDAAVRGGY